MNKQPQNKTILNLIRNNLSQAVNYQILSDCLCLPSGIERNISDDDDGRAFDYLSFQELKVPIKSSGLHPFRFKLVIALPSLFGQKRVNKTPIFLMSLPELFSCSAGLLLPRRSTSAGQKLASLQQSSCHFDINPFSLSCIKTGKVRPLPHPNHTLCTL